MTVKGNRLENKRISREAQHQNEALKRRDARKHIEDLIASMSTPESSTKSDGFFKNEY